MQRSAKKSQFHPSGARKDDESSPLSQSLVQYPNDDSPNSDRGEIGNLSVRRFPSEKLILPGISNAAKRSGFAKARAFSIDTNRSFRSEGGHLDLGKDDDLKDGESTTPRILKGDWKYKKFNPILSGLNSPNRPLTQQGSQESQRSEKSDSSVSEIDVSEKEPKVRTEAEKLLIRKMKKAFWVLYFLGIMFSLKNRVKVMGALRKLEIANEFERQRTMILHQSRPIPKLFPLLPTHKFTIFWTLILCILVISTALYTPFRVAFVEDDTDLTKVIDMIFTVGFGIDMVLNFITAYFDPKNGLVTSYKLIAKEYLKWWFWIDFVAIFPLDTILTSIALDEAGKSKSANKYNQLLRLLRIPRLYRLLKILRLFKMMRLFSNNQALSRIIKKFNLNMALVKMVKVVLNILFLNHLTGCLWFFIARMDDFGPDTWVARLNIRDESALTQYIASYYWSMQTLTTVGYGDIPPYTIPERIVCVLWMMTGVFFYSFTIGNLSNIIGNIDKTSEYIKTRLSSFNAFSLKVKLPEFMRQKVQRFFEINHKENIYYWIDSNHLLDQLPANLRTSLLLFSYYAMIKNISILQYDSNFTAALLVHFKLLKLKKKEIVYREEDPPEEIFFISRGSIRLVNEFEDPIYNLNEGTYFGEIEILLDATNLRKRICFAQAVESSVLLVCDKAAFLEVLRDFPIMQKQLERTATTRKDKISAAKERMAREIPENPGGGERKEKLLRSNEYLSDIIIGELASRDKRRKKSMKKPTTAVPVVTPVQPKELKVPMPFSISVTPSINDSQANMNKMEVQSDAGATPKSGLMTMIKNMKKQRDVVNSANVSMAQPSSVENSPKSPAVPSHKNSDVGSFSSYHSRDPESEAQSIRPQGQGDSEQDNPKVTHININKLDDPIRIENDVSPEEHLKIERKKTKEHPQSDKKQPDPSQPSGFAKRPVTATATGTAQSSFLKQEENLAERSRKNSATPLLYPSTDISHIEYRTQASNENIGSGIIDTTKISKSITFNSQTTFNSTKVETPQSSISQTIGAKVKLAIKKNNFLPTTDDNK